MLHKESIAISARESEVETQFVIPLSQPLPPHCFVKVVCDRFMHADAVLPVSFGKLVLPDRFEPPTALLDMRPMPTTSAAKELLAR